MQNSDTYKTIRNQSEGLYKDKGSKFIALVYPVKDEDEITVHLANIKKAYYDARHHCYAWALGFDSEYYKINDDGEPSGTAGKPIFGQIRSFELRNILIVVVRYFGGTKLGVRGLINAYKGAAHDAISNNVIITKTIRNYYRLYFPYLSMNDVMQTLKEYDLPQKAHQFDLDCQLEFSVRQNISDEVVLKFEKINDTRIEYLYTA
jgi:uncharacterized YigZ family protein